MTILEQYVTRNPMKVEARRMFRRFFHLGISGRSNAATLGALFLGLYGLCLIGWTKVAGVIGPEPVLMVEQLVLLLVPALGFYATIAGERENKTWDFLRVAPVTSEQIVYGKFLAGCGIVGLLWLGSIPFTLAALLEADSYTPFGYARAPGFDGLGPTLTANLVVVFAALLSLALTIFFSARAKTAIGSLVSILGLGFCWIVLWPAFLSTVMLGASADAAALLTGNPFICIGLCFSNDVSVAVCLAVLAIYTALIAGLLSASVQAVRES